MRSKNTLKQENMKWFQVMERLRCISWQWVLEHPRRLSSSFNRMIMVVSGRYSKGWSIVALVLARKVFKLYKSNGLVFVSQYLGTCQIVLMRFLADSPKIGSSYCPTTWCSCTTSGIPRIIPSSHRKVLRRRDKQALEMARIYLTIFGFHRVFVRKRTHPVLKNIEDIFDIDPKDRSVWRRFSLALESSLPELLYTCFPCTREVRIGMDWRPSWSKGPVSGKAKDSTNVMSLGLDAASYDAHRQLLQGTVVTSKGVKSGKSRPLPKPMRELGNYWYAIRDHIIGTPLSEVAPDAISEFCIKASPESKDQLNSFYLTTYGKLGRKYEGGGKVRVFTILDSIRQSCLRPVHDWAMSCLRLIPQDGTFDQTAPLRRLTKLVKYRGPMFCFDLTAATDRFPAKIQLSLITWAFGSGAAVSWLNNLRARAFSVPWKRGTRDELVWFQTGQPLGAFSSWPVFSLTHHLLVQYCANATSSGKWFDRYALLGDDIVIADREVAGRYKSLITALGVSISEKKTLESESCCVEFAKRFMVGREDISPLSFKAVFTMIPHTVGSMVTRISEFRTVRRSEPFRWLGAGYRILSQCMYPKGTGKRWKRYHLLLTSPKGPFPLPHLWWHSFYANRPVTEQDIAVVRVDLLSRTSIEFNPSLGIYEGLTGEEVRENIVMGKWLLTYYKLMTPFLLELMKSNDLTPWYSRPVMASTPIRGKRVTLLRYGTMFRCWDKVHAVSRRPTLLRLTPN
jgi:hypothetical protein